MDNGEIKLLEKIVQYKFDEKESKAWKVAVIYISLMKQFFPKYKQIKIPKGDPRKGILFKYCYKLIRDLENKVKDSDLKLYVAAQIQILRKISTEVSATVVGPQCLVGENAWKRWLVFKQKMEQSTNHKSADEAGVMRIKPEIFKKNIKETKEFLRKKEVTDIFSAVETGTIFKWAALNLLDPSIVLFDPKSREFVWTNKEKILERYGIDFVSIRNKLPEEAIKLFEEVK